MDFVPGTCTDAPLELPAHWPGRATRLNQTGVPQDEQRLLVGFERDGAHIVRRRVPASLHDLRLVNAPLDYLILLLPCFELGSACIAARLWA